MKKQPSRAVREYFAALGKKGGKASSSAGGLAAWRNMTTEQRSAEMKRRAKVRAQNLASARKKKA